MLTGRIAVIILQYMQISNHVVHLKRMCCMPIIPQLKKENGKKYCLVGDNLHTVKYPGLKLKRGFLSRRKLCPIFSSVHIWLLLQGTNTSHSEQPPEILWHTSGTSLETDPS